LILRALVLSALVVGGTAACGSGAPPARGPAGPTAPPPRDAREDTRRFAAVERLVLDRFAAADTRLAARTGIAPSDDAIRELQRSALLSEDTDAMLRGRSLDPFSFAARARAIGSAADLLMSFHDPLPEVAPPGSVIDRPALERQVLVRALDEERARIGAEHDVAPAGSALVDALRAGWDQGGGAERDAWLAKRLGQVRDAAREAPALLPADLDDALSPLERAMAAANDSPLAMGVLADLRALAAPARARAASATTPASLGAALQVHLGESAPVEALATRFAAVEATLRGRAQAALDQAGTSDTREKLREDAASLLLAGAPCPVVAGSPARSIRPPPEREAICGGLVVLDAAWGGPREVLALIALHDAAVLAAAALPGAKLDPASFLSRGEAGRTDRLVRLAASRPIVPIGVALAAEIVFRDPARARERLSAWLALGDVPLDVAAAQIR
jgi:hypothetical protein